MIKYIARLLKLHYLIYKNHHKSMLRRESIDEESNPAPWYTYGAINFLKSIQVDKVWEYGCGNSTHWWSLRSNFVYFVEHDKTWFQSIIDKKKSNVFGYLSTISPANSYSTSIKIPNTKFDVIIIDGEERVDCANVCIPFLTENGIIVLDNSDWFPEICDFLKSKGFQEIPFKGIGPINEYEWTTSVFIRFVLPSRG